MPRTIASIEDHYRLERALIAHPDGLTLAQLREATGIPDSTLRDHLHTAATHRRAVRTGDLWQPSPSWLMSLLAELAATQPLVGA